MTTTPLMRDIQTMTMVRENGVSGKLPKRTIEIGIFFPTLIVNKTIDITYSGRSLSRSITQLPTHWHMRSCCRLFENLRQHIDVQGNSLSIYLYSCARSYAHTCTHTCVCACACACVYTHIYIQSFLNLTWPEKFFTCTLLPSALLA